MPLYPQYCAATTATVCDEVFRVLMQLRRQPAVRIAPPYYNDRVYIESLASSTRVELSRLSFQPEVVLASFHGIPTEFVDKGDPYFTQCVETIAAAARSAQIRRQEADVDVPITLRPRQVARARNRQDGEKARQEWSEELAVITPGFSADCLETLEEIAVENAHIFKKNGGENFITHSLPQRQRTRHAGDLADGAARAQGLGLMLAEQI